MTSEKVYGSHDKTREAFTVQSLAPRPGLDEMEIWPRRGGRAPRVGDRLAVFVDRSTPYAMQPVD